MKDLRIERDYKHYQITDLVLKSFFSVYNALGYGFLEKVYENAMVVELKKFDLNVQQQVPINVYYEDIEVGLLLNFGRNAQFKRKIFDNEFKSKTIKSY